MPPWSTAVAIRGYAPVAAEPGTLSIEYAGGAVPAYAWSFPIASGGANVGYGVFDERGAGNRASLLERLAALLPGQEPDPATLRAHHLPLSTAPRFQPDGRVLLAGDAAAKVNPLTGEGIFDAVASGILAGRSALRGDDAGAAHRAAMEQTFARHHRHVGALARLAARPAFLDAAIGAAARHQRVFDCAVGLGLARGTVSPAALAVGAAHLPAARARRRGPAPGSRPLGRVSRSRPRSRRGRAPVDRTAWNRLCCWTTTATRSASRTRPPCTVQAPRGTWRSPATASTTPAGCW